MTAGAAAPRRWLLIVPALLAPVAVFVAFALGTAWQAAGRFALPVLATIAVYPVFARFVAAGRRGAAVAAALLWAASLSASLITHAARDPEAAGGGVLAGPSYRDEMFAFIAEGHGRESEPRQFVPQHLFHAGLFAAVTFLTGGLAGLLMGSVLVGYMSYYVGALAAGSLPMTAGLLGWPPWAIVRVVAFVLLGAALSRPLLVRLTRHRAPLFERADYRLIGMAAALLVLDIALKATFAPMWATLLRPALPH